MSDSDDEYNFDFVEKDITGSTQKAGARGLTNPPVYEQKQDLYKGANDYGEAKENDLVIEDDWDIEPHGQFTQQQPQVEHMSKQQI